MSSINCWRVKMRPGKETILYSSMNSFWGRVMVSLPVCTDRESHSITVLPMTCRRSLAIWARRSSAPTRSTISLTLTGLTI